METKTVFVFCLNFIFFQSIVAQCISSPAFIPEAYGIMSTGMPFAGIPFAGIPSAGKPTAALTTAGIPFAGIQPAGISAAAPIASIPTAAMPVAGIQTPFTSQLTMQIPMLPAPSFSILSDDLVVDGIVSVSGSLPFLGSVALGGTVPVAGEGLVAYNCGNGEVGMVRELPGARVPFAMY